jgi:hypothetical protein
MESIFESIVILKSNPVYRLSDVFFRKGIRWEQDRNTILTDDKYKDSILRDYLLHKKSENDFVSLRRIIQEHTQKYNYAIPGAHDLVVHIRTGDVFGTFNSAVKKKWSYSNIKGVLARRILGPNKKPQGRVYGTDAYDDFFEKVDVDSLDVSKIIIVSAMHFGANDITGQFFYEKKAVDRSLELLNNFKKKCDERSIEVALYSSEDTDKDLAFMCHSRHFVKGHSNMGDIIEKCLVHDANVFEVIAPASHMLKYKNSR